MKQSVVYDALGLLIMKEYSYSKMEISKLWILKYHMESTDSFLIYRLSLTSGP